MTIPKDIRAHLARAKAHLNANDLPKALESVSLALRAVSSQQHTSPKSLEQNFNATLKEISMHPQIISLLKNSDPSKTLTFQHGKESVLATVLQEFAKMLQPQAPKPSIKPEGTRLTDLFNKANNAFKKGEWGTGSSYLLRAAQEFDSEPDTLSYIATTLARAKQYQAAAKVYALGIKCDPKNLENYTQAINNYIMAEDYQNAEPIFVKALRQFGAHPRTYGRMATLYLLWKKYPEAKDYAERALDMDSSEKYAIEVLHELKLQDKS